MSTEWVGLLWYVGMGQVKEGHLQELQRMVKFTQRLIWKVSNKVHLGTDSSFQLGFFFIKEPIDILNRKE